MGSIILRTFLFAFFLQVVKSPLVMCAVGVGVGMYVEHSRPGTTAVFVAWAAGQAGGGVAALNPFSSGPGTASQPASSSEWENGLYRVR